MTEEIIKRQDDDLVPEASNLIAIADGLARSKMFPSIQNKEEALAVIEYGRELRLPPVISLQTITPIKGRLCVESKVYQALLERDGVSIKVLEKTKEVCRLEFKKEGKDAYTETFTIEDAKRAGLAGKQNFIAYTETMLYYRCMSKGAKVYSPGSCLGLYTNEEMEEVTDKKRTVKGTPRAAKKEKIEETKDSMPPDDEHTIEAKEENYTSPTEEEHEAAIEKPEPKPKKKAEPKTKEPEVIDDPSKATSQEMAETIQGDFQIRFGKNKWREKYKEFKAFLLDFQKTTKNPRKFINTNEHGRLSISLGIADDLTLLWKNFPYILLEWNTWEKKRKEEVEAAGEEEIPF